MKTLFSVLIVMVMISPLSATTLFQEDFTGSTDDVDLNGWNGWTADANKVFTSSVVIDSGMSMKAGYGTGWGHAYHSFSTTPGAGETTYELSGTFEPIAGYTPFLLFAVLDNDDGKWIRVELSDTLVGVRDSDANLQTASVASGTWDVKVAITDTSWNGYYKANGATDWIGLGGDNFSNALSGYDFMKISGYGGQITRGDSILLTSINPSPSYLLGDANIDGLVSADDYASVQASFGNTGAAGGGLMGDANHDGLVSADDYASVQANFGNTSGGMSAIPEPATIVLLAIGCTLTAFGRRRK